MWIEAPEFALQWQRGGSVSQRDGPTQTFQKNLDWFLRAPWVTLTALCSADALHMDHKAVLGTIPGGHAETLGRHLATPRGLDDATLARIDGPEGQACLAAAPAPPARWEDWAREAEAALLVGACAQGTLSGNAFRRRKKR